MNTDKNLSQNCSEEGDRHILLRRLRKMSQSPGSSGIGSKTTTRRAFLKTAATGLAAPLIVSSAALGGSPNDRPQVAVIGTGWRPDIQRVGRGFQIARQATKFADVVAICDVDRVAAEYARQHVTDNRADLSSDYREVLARDDIDAVLIATPDHWHAKIAIEAMRAGKDVYCEKPLTLTIDEGKQIGRVVQETGRVFQVGTQQRSEIKNRFLTAVALVQHGRIGKVRRVTVGIGPGKTGGPFQATSPPPQLNWDFWLGPAPRVPYIQERCHWTFRWWYEYAGGKLTDWGAHHVDIAQWAIGCQHTGPKTVGGTATFAQPIQEGRPTRDDTYNTAVEFDVHCQFADGVEIVINSGANGILFEGEAGRFFVNRGKLVGKPVEELANNPLPEDALKKLYKGKTPGSHMGNFFACMRTREQPISDVFTHQRAFDLPSGKHQPASGARADLGSGNRADRRRRPGECVVGARVAAGVCDRGLSLGAGNIY